MSLTGNGSKSIRRKDVQEQKSIAVGLKKLVMAHKAALGDTGINLTSLNNPTEMSSLGFTNPLSSEILGANLKFYRNNLRIVSSHKGLLMDYLSYTVDSGSRITFQGFTAEDGEIFMMTFEDAAKTGVQMVDAAPLTSTGTLAVGVTDYNVGTPFEVNKYPTSQVGSVLVFRNGVIQFRNPNNGTSGGNYQEVQAGSGLGVIIRFNNAPVGIEDNILVVSNGLLVYRPDGSLMAEIETLAGQLDVHREILEDVTGLPIAPGAPNNVDLKAFGDQVLNHEQRIDVLETPVTMSAQNTSGLNTLNNTFTTFTGWTSLSDSHSAFNASTGIYTVPVSGFYTIAGTIAFNGNATSNRGITILKNGSTAIYTTIIQTGAAGTNNSVPFAGGFYFSAGDTIALQIYQLSGGNLAATTAANYNQLAIVRVGS